MTFRTAPRLSGFDYAGTYAYSLTIVTAHRQPVFCDPRLIDRGVHHLGISAGKYGFTTLAYCFMPDHLHMLVAGDEWSSLTDFVRHFKQLTGYEYKQARGVRLWQPSYWDHVLRIEEDIEDVARYIWANPLRAGLAVDWREYVGCGPRPMPDWI